MNQLKNRAHGEGMDQRGDIDSGRRVSAGGLFSDFIIDTQKQHSCVLDNDGLVTCELIARECGPQHLATVLAMLSCCASRENAAKTRGGVAAEVIEIAFLERFVEAIYYFICRKARE